MHFVRVFDVLFSSSANHTKTDEDSSILFVLLAFSFHSSPITRKDGRNFD